MICVAACRRFKLTEHLFSSVIRCSEVIATI